jgi:RNA polymerase sigma factor (sigma-70 family)
MLPERSDQDFLRLYASSGAEDSFRALVERYTDLVFGTAVRIANDRTAAEEVTQNVFIALARKAAFLPADTCLAAWLHRSAVLEARNWIRGEIRRKRREEHGGAIMTQPDDSLLKPLLRALDEALLDLREQDRAALLLRFVQGRNLREVGATLGVSDDTAQKRVAKALDILTRAFRKRGYTVPSVALTVSALETSAQMAPLGLMGASASAALSAGTPAASLSGLVRPPIGFKRGSAFQSLTVTHRIKGSPDFRPA